MTHMADYNIMCRVINKRICVERRQRVEAVCSIREDFRKDFRAGSVGVSP